MIIGARPHPRAKPALTTGAIHPLPSTVPRQPPPPEFKNKDRNIHNNGTELGLPGSWLKCETSATVLTLWAATTTTIKQAKVHATDAELLSFNIFGFKSRIMREVSGEDGGGGSRRNFLPNVQ